ncbi:MAG: BAR domain-containing protein [Gammaproteobacteria bacterium]
MQRSHTEKLDKTKKKVYLDVIKEQFDLKIIDPKSILLSLFNKYVTDSVASQKNGLFASKRKHEQFCRDLLKNFYVQKEQKESVVSSASEFNRMIVSLNEYAQQAKIKPHGQFATLLSTFFSVYENYAKRVDLSLRSQLTLNSTIECFVDFPSLKNQIESRSGHWSWLGTEENLQIISQFFSVKYWQAFVKLQMMNLQSSKIETKRHALKRLHEEINFIPSECWPVIIKQLLPYLDEDSALVDDYYLQTLIAKTRLYLSAELRVEIVRSLYKLKVQHQLSLVLIQNQLYTLLELYIEDTPIDLRHEIIDLLLNYIVAKIEESKSAEEKSIGSRPDYVGKQELVLKIFSRCAQHADSIQWRRFIEIFLPSFPKYYSDSYATFKLCVRYIPLEVWPVLINQIVSICENKEFSLRMLSTCVDEIPDVIKPHLIQAIFKKMGDFNYEACELLLTCAAFVSQEHWLEVYRRLNYLLRNFSTCRYSIYEKLAVIMKYLPVEQQHEVADCFLCNLGLMFSSNFPTSKMCAALIEYVNVVSSVQRNQIIQKLFEKFYLEMSSSSDWKYIADVIATYIKYDPATCDWDYIIKHLQQIIQNQVKAYEPLDSLSYRDGYAAVMDFLKSCHSMIPKSKWTELFNSILPLFHVRSKYLIHHPFEILATCGQYFPYDTWERVIDTLIDLINNLHDGDFNDNVFQGIATCIPIMPEACLTRLMMRLIDSIADHTLGFNVKLILNNYRDTFPAVIRQRVVDVCLEHLEEWPQAPVLLKSYIEDMTPKQVMRVVDVILQKGYQNEHVSIKDDQRALLLFFVPFFHQLEKDIMDRKIHKSEISKLGAWLTNVWREVVRTSILNFDSLDKKHPLLHEKMHKWIVYIPNRCWPLLIKELINWYVIRNRYPYHEEYL